MRYAALLLILPVVLAGIVYYLTLDEPKTYVSNTTVYTGIATGSSIVSLQESRVDLFGTRTAFDNLIRIINSKTTAEEVGLRLFTSHMIIDKPAPNIISRDSYHKLMEMVPDEVKALVVKGNFDSTYNNLLAFKNSDNHNFLYGLINLNHPNYSYSKIQGKLRVSRIQTSDMIEMIYRSDDPGICYNTLKIFNEVFVIIHQGISINQSDAVLQYFQAQLNDANRKLTEAENDLLEFNQRHNIINYYEQTKHIASEREHFNLEYNSLRMDSASAAQVLRILEGKMDGNEKRIINSGEIIQLRKRLAEVNLKISMKTNQTVSEKVSEDDLIEELSELQLLAFQLAEEMKTKVKAQYELEHSPEGVTSTSLLDRWLEQVILLENTKARLVIGNMKKREFQDLFSQYAPLGATMKWIERKIDIAEREYLSILHSLNLARLKQQNLELNSNIKVVDPPFFPLKSQASKRKFLIIVAFMVGFILPAFTIIALEFLDSNIKNIRKAEEVSGLKVAAVFPNLSHKKRSIDYEFIQSKSLDVLVRNLMLNKKEREDAAQPVICAVFSNQPGEGKTLLTTSLLKKLADYNFRLLYLSYDDVAPDGFDFRKYQVDSCFMKVTRFKKLNADWEGVEIDNYNFVFIEIPGIIQNSYPLELFKNINISYIVTRANRAWGYADTGALSDVLKMNPDRPPQMLLNGVNVYEMENVLGDLPRRRSLLRRVIKNILRLRFFSRSKLNGSADNAANRSNGINKAWLLLLLIPMLGAMILQFGSKLISRPEALKAKPPEEILQGVSTFAIPKLIESEKKTETGEAEDIIPEKQSEPETIPTESVPVERYYLVAGSFHNEDNAKKRFEQLKFRGNDPLILETDKGLIPVAVGKFNTREEAEIARREFLKKEPRSGVWIKSVVELLE
jgi:polysaccharide biosynthesis transport protein